LISQITATDDSVAPSEQAILRAKAAFKPASRPAGASWLQAVDRFIARLVFDSRVHQVAVRYADAGDRVTMTYESDVAEIDLQADRMRSSDDCESWRFIGQVSRLTAGSSEHSQNQRATASLTASGAKTSTADVTVDQRGSFTFDAPAGKYELVIRLPDGTVVIPDIEVR
jgi:hypothetical protein